MNNNDKEIATLGEELEKFDPSNIDLTEFKNIASKIPKDSSIPLQVAENLAMVFLRAADRCSEILSHLTWVEQKCKSDKVAEFSKAVLKAKEEEPRMAVSLAEHKAKCNSNYLEAVDRCLKAEAARRWFDGKYEIFLKTHQMMKERLRSETKHQYSSGFNESSGHENTMKFGETDWK